MPGRGPIHNRDLLLDSHNMLSTIEGRINSLIGWQTPLGDILAAAPTADLDPVWGRGYVPGDIFVPLIVAGWA